MWRRENVYNSAVFRSVGASATGWREVTIKRVPNPETNLNEERGVAVILHRPPAPTPCPATFPDWLY